ncbi:hypothetical protein BOVMAS28_11150 [Streptococcus uberis]
MVDEATGNIDFYSDPTHMDYSKLYEINELVVAILNKKYGKDVRYSLANALQRVYHDASISGNANMEVSMSRGNHETLYDRINDLDNSSLNLLNEFVNINSRLNSIVANAGNGSVPSEVAEMRVDEYGLTFPTASIAVKTQLSRKVPFSIGDNLVNKLAATAGYFYSATAGTKQANASYQYNTIMSEENITYYMNIKANIHIAYFDLTGKYLGGLVDPSTFTTPAGTKYFIVSYTTAQANLIMVAKSPITVYKPYIEGVDAAKILNSTLSADKFVPELKEKVDSMVVFEPGINLINKDVAQVGYYRGYSNGNLTAQSLYQINYIKVNAGDTYYIQFASNVHIAFFDSKDVYISGPSPTGLTSVVVPTNAVKMSVSYQIAQKDTIVVSKTQVDQFQPFVFGINGENINPGTISQESLDENLAALIGTVGNTVNVGPGQEYTSLLQAISDHATVPDITYKLINYHVDMYQEYIDYYGADFFINYTGYDGSSDYNLRGYNLKFGDKLIADHRSSIKWTYDNSNDKVCTYFSPLNMTMNNYVKDLYIKITDGSCRYIVHDDFAWGKEGINHYDNCKFEGKSKFEQGIGGGFGFNSTYLIDTCKFINCGPDALTYHVNSGTGGKNKYIVKDTYLTPGSSIRGTYYGTSTEVSEMTVTGCRADKIYVKAHTTDGTSPNVNLELTEWHNDVLPV